MRKTTLILKSHPLKTCFPPNDEFAALIARLCILREDWWLAFTGYSTELMPDLDKNSQIYRQLYFLRHLVLALSEIHDTIKALNSLAEFRAAIANTPTDLRKQFESGLKFLNKNNDIIKQTRNRLGGHVSGDVLPDVINKITGTAEATCVASTILRAHISTSRPRSSHFCFFTSNHGRGCLYSSVACILMRSISFTTHSPHT